MRALAKPEYLARPGQLLRRAAEAIRPPRATALVVLPWGLVIEVDPRDAIGRAIANLGVYDLRVTEAAWRLIEPGETVVDVGANIGYLTGLMAVRVGRLGTVIAVEAHPKVFLRLVGNLDRWKVAPEFCQVRALNIAAGAAAGEGFLFEPEAFAENQGTAKVLAAQPGALALPPVRIEAIDSIATGPVGLMKIDVEGGEPETLEGARQLLDRKAVRDILFEDYGRPPSRSMTFLMERGYRIFAMRRPFFGPLLVDADVPEADAWEAPSYLATAQPERAIERMGGRGWRCLN
jgi:FkbM family methyltransferase